MKQYSQKKLFVWVFLLVILFTNRLGAQTTKGKDFWFGYMYNLVDNAPLEVYISAERIVSGTVTIPGTGFSQAFNVAANTTVLVSIPNTVMAANSSDVIEAKAIHIETCDTVSIYSINKGAFSDDATVIYPTPILGNDYMVLTMNGNPGDWGKEFLIVASTDNSVIEINPSVATDGGHAANVPYTITLNKGDQYQVTSNSDLTGTTVKGSLSNGVCSNFAVFSGSKCLNIGGCSACDHIYEQIMPTKAWGVNFVVGKFAQKSALIYRVLASTNGTSFTIDGGAPVSLNAGQFYEYSNSGGVDASFITANNPVMIMQYMAGSDCDNGMGDPDQVLISPIEQTMNVATFYTIPSPAVTVFYANISAKTSAVAGIKLNGASISGSFIPVPSNPQYSYATGVSLVQGTNYQLTSDTGFCAFVYGMGTYESYTYTVGSSLRDLTTDFTILSPNQICPGETWGFQAINDPLASNYLWDYGDGSTGSGINSTHIYAADGTYPVSMTKVMLTGCDQELVKNLTVKGPVIKIRGTDTICYGESVNLWTGGNDSVLIEVPTPCGDTIRYKVLSHNDQVLWSTGSTDTLITVSPTVTTMYYLTGQSTGTPCTAIDSFLVHVVKISALFTADSVCFGDNTSFTNQSTIISDSITSWNWNFGDFTPDSITQNPTHTYASAGTWNVKLIATSNYGCRDSITSAVPIYALPFAHAGADQIICGSSTAALAGSITGSAISGAWSGGTGTYNPNNTTLTSVYTPSAAELTAGSVTLLLTTNDPLGPCSSSSDTVVITINPPAIVLAGADQTICNGNTVTLAGSISGSATSGTWSGGAGAYAPDNTSPTAIYTPSATEATAGIVTLIYTTNNPAGPCPSVSDTVTITINQLPTANAGSTQYVCSGIPITLAGSIAGSATSASWSGGTGTYAPNNTTLNAVYTPSAAELAADSATLTLTTNDPIGPCNASLSNVTFHFYNNPVVSLTVDDSTGCPIHCVNFTNGTTVDGGDVISTWNWNFGDDSEPLTTPEPSHCYSIPGYYDITLTAISNHNCSSTLTVNDLIQVFNDPVAAFSPTPNPATVLEPTITFINQSSSDVNYWHWDFGDGDTLAPDVASPVHIYPNDIPTQYLATLIVHNENDCYDTVSRQIIIGPEFTFFIPNFFSPNGDGVNDYFFGAGTGIIKYDLWIFDRWGNRIFHGNELDDKWNGIVDSETQVAQIDVYVWKAELTDVFNKRHTYTGTVTLVR
ncbi:MAG: PKD domain-containing protein [Bacteroidota bacterium]